MQLDLAQKDIYIGSAFLIASGAYICQHLYSTHAAVKDASKNVEKVKSFVHDSPCVRATELEKGLKSKSNSQNSSIYLKLDSKQPSGSHRIRAVANIILSILQQKDSKIDALVTSSVGDIGVAVAYCANHLKLKCILFCSKPFSKYSDALAKFKKLNCKIEIYGDTQNECDDKAKSYANEKRNNAAYIPHKENSTAFLAYSRILTEFTENRETSNIIPDCIVVPTTDGDLLSGIIGGVLKNNWQKNTKIVAAQLESHSLFDAAVRNNNDPVPVTLNGKNAEYLKFGSISQKAMYFQWALIEKYSNAVKSIVIEDDCVDGMQQQFATKYNLQLTPSSIVGYVAVHKCKGYFAQFQDILVIVSSDNYIHIDNDKDTDDEYKQQESEEEDDDTDYDDYDSDDEEP